MLLNLILDLLELAILLKKKIKNLEVYIPFQNLSYQQRRKKQTQKDPNITDLEKELSDKIGLRTSIHFNESGSSGSLTLYYSDLNQLDDIMKRLKK